MSMQFVTSVLDRILELPGVSKGDLVCDIGAATGRLLDQGVTY